MNGIHPKQQTPAEALIEAGLAFPGVRCFDGQRAPPLDVCAINGARLCVERRRLNHWDWAYRKAACEAQLPGVNIEEIAGMTWRDKMGEKLSEAGASIFASFRQSSGHWRIASRRWRLYGLGMERDGDTWYGVIVVGDDFEKFLGVAYKTEAAD